MLAAMPLLEVDDLQVGFPLPRPRPWAAAPRLRAVAGLSLSLAAGETLGVVGESGCGKSTLLRALLGLETVDAGAIRFDGVDVTHARGATLRTLRRGVQMVFQDPYGSLNPRLRAGQVLEEALRANFKLTAAERVRRTAALLERVGLGPALKDRFPHELSGGQRQRLGIARALAVEPRLLLADEPVSALDVSVQAQIINLFAELRRDLNLACLFIAHDLAVVRHLCDRVAVMYLGRIVETGPAAAVYTCPMHPYTRALLAAAPEPVAGKRLARAPLAGEPPSPAAPPPGCPFHPRCPLAVSRCRQERPELLPAVDDPTHQAACHVTR